MSLLSNLDKQISETLRKNGDLKVLRKEVDRERKKLEKFFDMFLDEYNGRLNTEKTNTPEWKLYKSKLNEYEQYDDAIQTIDHYLSKETV